MTESLELRHLIAAGSALGGGLLVGLLVYRLVLRPIVKHSTLTKTGADDVVLGAIRKASVLWFVVAGAFVARLSLPLKAGPARAVDRTLLALIIISFTFVIARIIGDALKLYALRRSGVLPSSSIFINIARLIVVVVGFLVLLQTFGVSITPLLTALGVGGLAIALALQDTLANLFAGLQLLAAKKVRLGDFIKLDSGDEGEVIDINWRHTSLRQLPNNIVIVPNSRLAGSIITNFHMPQSEMSVVFQMGVAYEADLEHVERVTIEVATETMRDVPGAIKSFEPFIRYHTFGDSSINFSIILRCESYTDQYMLKHEFVKRLHKRYAEEGIEIPFPQRTLHFADEAAEAVRGNGRTPAKKSSSKRSKR